MALHSSRFRLVAAGGAARACGPTPWLGVPARGRSAQRGPMPAADEPMTSSSRSNLGGRSTLGRCIAHLPGWSAGVRACPPLSVGIVTQLDTHVPLDANSWLGVIDVWWTGQSITNSRRRFAAVAVVAVLRCCTASQAEPASPETQGLPEHLRH